MKRQDGGSARDTVLWYRRINHIAIVLILTHALAATCGTLHGTSGSYVSVTRSAVEAKDPLWRDASSSRCPTARSSCSKLACRAGIRAITSTSQPPLILGSRRRMDSLIKRLTRFRTTALPILRLAENANRLSARSLSCLTRTSQRLCHD